jgi:hypothetical protein
VIQILKEVDCGEQYRGPRSSPRAFLARRAGRLSSEFMRPSELQSHCSARVLGVLVRHIVGMRVGGQ